MVKSAASATMLACVSLLATVVGAAALRLYGLACHVKRH